jgi:hypothetical protein
VRGTNRDSW